MFDKYFFIGLNSNEKLVGYGGGLEIKEFLLNLEKRNSLKKIEK